MTSNTTYELLPHGIECKCGCGFGTNIDEISEDVLHVFWEITNNVQTLLKRNISLIVSSGCRCEKHNREIGGAKHSFHVKGYALDIICPSVLEYDDFYKICDRVIGTKGGVGYYKKQNFVHIDTRGYYRRWCKG